MEDFVSPERVRLSLSGGHFIDIKKRLNHGETEDMYARWSPTVAGEGEPVQYKRTEVRTSKVLFYLLGWSLMNDGHPVPVSPDIPEDQRLATIRSLDPDRFSEIHQAIQAHEGKMLTERAAQKKTNGGAPLDAPTLPSRSEPAGSLSTSEPLTLMTAPS